MTATSSDASNAYPKASIGWYATIMLTIAYTLSFIDRQILNLLAEPIRIDLGLSDTQISMLQGVAFVGTYILFSLPVGRLVDTRNRIWLLVGGVAFWSLATTACGLAKSYTQLFIGRMGVGLGEATLTPVAWSLIADYFSPKNRPLPISVFLIGPYLGAGIALIAGGQIMGSLSEVGSIALPIIGNIQPWQFTFMAVGIPGLLFALFLQTISEPARQGVTNKNETAMSMKAVFAFIWEKKQLYFAFLIGVPFIIIVLYGLQAWVPTYLLRTHGMSLADTGTQYGIVALISGSSGVLAGPFVGAFLQRKGYTDYHLRVAILAAVMTIVFAGLISIATTPAIALLFIGLAGFAVTLPLALIAAGLQDVTPPQMRGVLAGCYVMMTNVIGMGLGPMTVALCTDYIFSDPNMVGHSLSLVALLSSIIAIFCLAMGLKPFRQEIAAQSSIDKSLLQLIDSTPVTQNNNVAQVKPT
jgi:MFS family permease